MPPETGLCGKCGCSSSTPDFPGGQRHSLFRLGSFGVSECILSLIIGLAVWAFFKQAGICKFCGCSWWRCACVRMTEVSVGCLPPLFCFLFWEDLLLSLKFPFQLSWSGQQTSGLLVFPLSYQWDYKGVGNPNSGPQALVGNILLDEPSHQYQFLFLKSNSSYVLSKRSITSFDTKQNETTKGFETCVAFFNCLFVGDDMVLCCSLR